MEPKGHFTRQEILSQPQAWAAALEWMNVQRSSLEGFARDGYGQILFTGCGSTYYLSLAAAALTQELSGRPCRALPASELWMYPQSSYIGRTAAAGKTLLVASSRSGETSETLHACEAFLAKGCGDLVTLSCYGEAPLSKMGTHNLVLPSGQEQSVAQTRAFTTLYLGTVALACLWSGRRDLFETLARLPEVSRRILNDYSPLAGELGSDSRFDRFYFLGSGPRHGLACELSLKMKEMSLSHSEPFHFMEFRHGPKSMVTSSALVIGLRSTANAAFEAAVLEDVRALGGCILAMGEEQAKIQFRSGLAEAVRDVLYLPVGQWIAFERSLSKGLDPDRPNNLDAVVKLSQAE